MKTWFVALAALWGVLGCDFFVESKGPIPAPEPQQVDAAHVSPPGQQYAAAPQAAPAAPADANTAALPTAAAAAAPQDAAVAAAPQDANAAAPQPILAAAPATPMPAAAPQTPPPPAHWKGTGVLAKTKDKPPRGAPRWAAVAAEVVEHDSQRFLRTTGKVEDIKNPALARSTAENRARAEMARWLGADSIAGAGIINVWERAKGHVTMTQMEVALPPEALAAAP